MPNPTAKTVYPLDQTACRNIDLCSCLRKEKAGTPRRRERKAVERFFMATSNKGRVAVERGKGMGRPHLLRKKCCAGKRLNQFLLF